MTSQAAAQSEIVCRSAFLSWADCRGQFIMIYKLVLLANRQIGATNMFYSIINVNEK